MSNLKFPNQNDNNFKKNNLQVSKSKLLSDSIKNSSPRSVHKFKKIKTEKITTPKLVHNSSTQSSNSPFSKNLTENKVFCIVAGSIILGLSFGLGLSVTTSFINKSKPGIIKNPDIPDILVNNNESNKENSTTDETPPIFYDGSDKKDFEEEIVDNSVSEENYSEQFVFPYSNTERLTYNDTNDLSLDDIVLAKFEILARHGFIFDPQKRNLYEHFVSKSWYSESHNFSFDKLSELEQKNYHLLEASQISLTSYLTSPEVSYEFVFPYSNAEKISSYDVQNLSNWELQIAKNELYARYGHTFSLENLNNHFYSTYWYSPASSNDGIKLNNIEEYNQTIILNEIENRKNKILTSNLSMFN